MTSPIAVVLLRFFLSALIWSFTSASPLEHDAVAQRAISYSDSQVKSLISSVQAVASAFVNPFCTSYLHYASPTTTTTVTRTTTSVVSRSTTKDVTVTTTVVQTDTKTATVQYTAPAAARKEKRNAAPAPAATVTALAADSSSSVLGFAAGVVSEACSCLVTKPTKTATNTYTQSKTVTATSTATVSSTKTTAKTAKTTITSTIAACANANPTFYLQFRDTDPARTDQYNNQYADSVQDEYRGVSPEGVLTTTPSLSSAVLLTLDLQTGYLRTVAEGWFANVDYFVDLAPVYFNTAEFVDQAQFQYLKCSITQSGGTDTLGCTVPYPDPRSVFQTCPLYAEYYQSAVALGDVLYDAPMCYRVQLVVIPVCVPKGK